MGRRSVLLALLFLFTSSLAHAVSCHCFNQRDFDPADPASADPYILATAGNSLLAGSAATEKSQVVKMRMGGAGETDLWIALHLGKAIPADPGVLLEERSRLGSWAKVAASHTPAASKLGGEFFSLLAGDERGAAQFLADRTLAAAFPSRAKTLPLLRAEEATTSEMTLALFLDAAAKADPVESLRKVRNGGVSWGTLLNGIGITPKALSPRIIALARPPQ